MKIPTSALFVAVLFLVQQPPQAPLPLIRENATVKVCQYVYVIPDGNVGAVPNVGIVVGTRATLVNDTGLGPRNGQTVLRETGKVSQNANLYIVATHFHAEHILGESVFPQTVTTRQSRLRRLGSGIFGAFVGRTKPCQSQNSRSAAAVF
jgi:glyoxylase-like metal-dependent hydrolase (beta-lactamase superfamily II)